MTSRSICFFPVPLLIDAGLPSVVGWVFLNLKGRSGITTGSFVKWEGEAEGSRGVLLKTNYSSGGTILP